MQTIRLVEQATSSTVIEPLSHNATQPPFKQCMVAFQLARVLRQKPAVIAAQLADACMAQPGDVIDHVEVAGAGMKPSHSTASSDTSLSHSNHCNVQPPPPPPPGFLNIYLRPQWATGSIEQLARHGVQPWPPRYTQHQTPSSTNQLTNCSPTDRAMSVCWWTLRHQTWARSSTWATYALLYLGTPCRG